MAPLFGSLDPLACDQTPRLSDSLLSEYGWSMLGAELPVELSDTLRTAPKGWFEFLSARDYRKLQETLGAVDSALLLSALWGYYLDRLFYMDSWLGAFNTGRYLIYDPNLLRWVCSESRQWRENVYTSALEHVGSVGLESWDYLTVLLDGEVCPFDIDSSVTVLRN